jgi:hypothetical protein
MRIPRRVGAFAVMCFGPAIVGLAIVGLAGCGPNAGKPASKKELEHVREEYAVAGTVGRVVEVLESAKLAAVTDIPVDQANEGDLVAFVDQRNRPLVSGTVVAKAGNQLHVRYVTPRPERRPPRVGDLAVHMPGKSPNDETRMTNE